MQEKNRLLGHFYLACFQWDARLCTFSARLCMVGAYRRMDVWVDKWFRMSEL